jgi:phosphoribosylanthranilate isomerase
MSREKRATGLAPVRLFVKICGITSLEDGLAAAEAGADAVGFVFWAGSPRCVTPARARAIGVKLPSGIVRVGVFVDAPRARLERTASEAGLDLLQLHGSEGPEALLDLARPAWKALRIGDGFAPEAALRYEGRAAGLLFDGYAGTKPGGTGRPFDWRLARHLRARLRFLIVAGGLTPENVATAIRVAEPDGVDVSSGVERSPGRKDAARVRAFVVAAREAHARRPEPARSARA